MKRKQLAATLFAILLLGGHMNAEAGASGKAAVTVKESNCEYSRDPLGIDVVQPRFSWILESGRRGQVQSAYKLLVASSEGKLKSNRGDKWDSGRVASDRSVNVAYEGKALSSAEKCYWKVRVWDGNGRASDYSAPATFEMGLLEKDDWKAE